VIQLLLILSPVPGANRLRIEDISLSLVAARTKSQ
jgi:hypothetical protein